MTRILIVLLATLGFHSCTSDFEEINTNPNAPVEVPTAYIITSGERSLVNELIGQGGIADIGQHYVEYLSQTQYTDITTYNTAESSFYPLYRDGLKDLQTVIDLNTDEATKVTAAAGAAGSNANQIALATILQQWAFLNITDIWGDAPYSEALNGRDNLGPVYDRQEDIYRGAVAKLTTAGDMIEEGSVAGDIIYNGDMDKWRKFANSLILRAGLRVSNVDPILGQEWTRLALSRGVLVSNADNAQIDFPGTGGEGNNSWFNNFRNRFDYAVSEPIVNTLKALDDPRLTVYAQPTQNSDGTDTIVYNGMPYGLSESEAGKIKNATISFPGLAFIGSTAPSVILTYSEVRFNEAEAAARGWTDGDAEALYDLAITASMNQWGITDTSAIEEYLAQAGVAYNTDNFKQSIGEQKWLALYFQGIEGWSEYRRLSYPQLAPAPAAVLTDIIPRRRAYTTTEFSLNRVSYNEALDRQFGGEDPLTGRVWWDVPQ